MLLVSIFFCIRIAAIPDVLWSFPILLFSLHSIEFVDKMADKKYCYMFIELQYAEHTGFSLISGCVRNERIFRIFWGLKNEAEKFCESLRRIFSTNTPAGSVQRIWCDRALLSTVPAGGTGSEASSPGASRRWQVPIFVRILFRACGYKNGSTRRTGKTDRLSGSPTRQPKKKSKEILCSD